MAKVGHSTWVLENTARVHVAYELRIMCALAGAVRPVGDGDLLDLLDTIYLESMLLHVRNLDEFLRDTKALNKESIRGFHYFDPDVTWTPICALSGPAFGRLSTSLAHISRKRLCAEAWESSDGSRAAYAWDVLRAFDLFVTKLHADGRDDRAEWFEDGIRVAKRVLAVSEAEQIGFEPIRHPGYGSRVVQVQADGNWPVFHTSSAGTLIRTVTPPDTRPTA